MESVIDDQLARIDDAEDLLDSLSSRLGNDVCAFDQPRVDKRVLHIGSRRNELRGSIR